MKPSFRKAGAPALAIAISCCPDVRNSRLAVGSAALAGCAHLPSRRRSPMTTSTPAVLHGRSAGAGARSWSCRSRCRCRAS